MLGKADGVALGGMLGKADGVALGSMLGKADGVALGVALGAEDGIAEGLGLGAGVRYIGHLYGDLNNDFKSPGVTLFDAGLRFDLGRLSPDAAGASLAVNATNLLDERYVSTCLSATGCYWGPGRAVTASIKYRW